MSILLMGMDDSVTAVLKRIARGDVAWNDVQEYCLYCDRTSCHHSKAIAPGYDYEEIKHEETCPIPLSRNVLAKQDLPIRLYRVDLKRTIRQVNGAHWVKDEEVYVLAFDENEVIETYRDCSYAVMARVTLIGTYPFETTSHE